MRLFKVVVRHLGEAGRKLSRISRGKQSMALGRLQECQRVNSNRTRIEARTRCKLDKIRRCPEDDLVTSPTQLCAEHHHGLHVATRSLRKQREAH